ncbi:SDR family oxidoreductase [soil metagenome]
MSQDLAGKNVVVTGATSGIGRVTALELAKRGAHVIMANRSSNKSAPVAAEIRAATGSAPEVVSIDLGDLASVRAAATEILAKDLPIHILVNNAGLAGQRGMTRSGFELAFGTNHVGHFLFTHLLLDRIKTASPARIVTVASKLHENIKHLDWDAVTRPTRTLTGVHEYGVSKLANILFSAELARRLEGTGVTTYALHPGGVATDVYRQLPQPLRWFYLRRMLTPEQGAHTSIKCATDPALATTTGRYYDPRGNEQRPSHLACDPALARELWRRSSRWAGVVG